MALSEARTADIVATTTGGRVLNLGESNVRELMTGDQRFESKLLLHLCRCMCARLLGKEELLTRHRTGHPRCAQPLVEAIG